MVDHICRFWSGAMHTEAIIFGCMGPGRGNKTKGIGFDERR